MQKVYTKRIYISYHAEDAISPVRRAKTNLEKLPALLPIISVPWRTMYLCTQTEP